MKAPRVCNEGVLDIVFIGNWQQDAVVSDKHLLGAIRWVVRLVSRLIIAWYIRRHAHKPLGNCRIIHNGCNITNLSWGWGTPFHPALSPKRMVG